MKSPIIWLVILVLIVVNSSRVLDVQSKQVFLGESVSHINELTKSITHQKMEKGMSQNLISAEIEPLPNKANQAALALQRLGFQIFGIGAFISVQGQRSLWESTFNISFKEEKKTVIAEIESEETYFKPITYNLLIPEELESLIGSVVFVEPPEFY